MRWPAGVRAFTAACSVTAWAVAVAVALSGGIVAVTLVGGLYMAAAVVLCWPTPPAAMTRSHRAAWWVAAGLVAALLVLSTVAVLSVRAGMTALVMIWLAPTATGVWAAADLRDVRAATR
jgi:hypothetical protein